MRNIFLLEAINFFHHPQKICIYSACSSLDSELSFSVQAAFSKDFYKMTGLLNELLPASES